MIFLKPESFARPLQIGDEVLTAAPSSVIKEKEPLLEGLKVLENWGLNCRKPESIGRQWGYLAGKDEIRLKELHPFKASPLIAFARGGWGSSRLLEYNESWNRGWLVGFSDISSILLSRTNAGFDGSVHGPLITSIAKEPNWSKERLRALLFGEEVPDLFGQPWKGGKANGPLIVSNLTILTHLIGSNHLPSFDNAILILEDVGEEPYRIDRMMTQLRLAGLLQKISGLGFGKFKECNPKDADQNPLEFSLEEILKERSNDLGIPIVSNFDVGHCAGNAALPLGRQAELDGNQGILRVFPF